MILKNAYCQQTVKLKRPDVADRKIFTFNRQFWRTITELRFIAALILPQSLCGSLKKRFEDNEQRNDKISSRRDSSAFD